MDNEDGGNEEYDEGDDGEPGDHRQRRSAWQRAMDGLLKCFVVVFQVHKRTQGCSGKNAGRKRQVESLGANQACPCCLHAGTSFHSPNVFIEPKSKLFGAANSGERSTRPGAPGKTCLAPMMGSHPDAFYSPSAQFS